MQLRSGRNTAITTTTTNPKVNQKQRREEPELNLLKLREQIVKSNNFKDTIGFKVYQSSYGLKTHVKEIYCSKKLRTENIFPQQQIYCNNNINYFSSKVYKIDLLPFECPRILVPKSQDRYFKEILIYYLDLTGEIKISNKIEKYNDFVNLLRKLTYINFIYNFICDNIHNFSKINMETHNFNKEKLKQTVISQGKEIIGNTIYEKIKEYEKYVEEYEDSHLILSGELDACISKLKENLDNIEEIIRNHEKYC